MDLLISLSANKATKIGSIEKNEILNKSNFISNMNGFKIVKNVLKLKASIEQMYLFLQHSIDTVSSIKNNL
jgi:hypothetical protein